MDWISCLIIDILVECHKCVLNSKFGTGFPTKWVMVPLKIICDSYLSRVGPNLILVFPAQIYAYLYNISFSFSYHREQFYIALIIDINPSRVGPNRQWVRALVPESKEIIGNG